MKAEILRRLINLKILPRDQALAPGERIVSDELLNNGLVIVVSERITGDRTDNGRKASQCAGR